ncbi:MAG: hypothetical protein ABI591_32930 [Kofleriaceae bacterium]
MTLVRLLTVCALAAGCVKPPAAPRSSYDLYQLCGDVHAEGVCAPSTETGMKVDTNFATPVHGVVVARG